MGSHKKSGLSIEATYTNPKVKEYKVIYKLYFEEYIN
jgi:hypothetical protein